MRSGFATLVGRPNGGKSTLLNALVGAKVSIVSERPQTTRTEVRGILERDGAQVVFVDTPGLHKPRNLAGERYNTTALRAADGVDVVCLVLDATAPMGSGDRFVAARVPAGSICVVNKVDVARPAQVLQQLQRAGELGLAEYFPVSARTGQGLDALVDGIVGRLPEGPAWYPEGTITDTPEAVWVAELVREQLLAVLHDELPHSVACRVTEWDGPRIRVEIAVGRESQKGMVIGRGGLLLRDVGMAVRRQLDEGIYLELVVRVDPDWPRRSKALDRLGL